MRARRSTPQGAAAPSTSSRSRWNGNACSTAPSAPPGRGPCGVDDVAKRERRLTTTTMRLGSRQDEPKPAREPRCCLRPTFAAGCGHVGRMSRCPRAVVVEQAVERPKWISSSSAAMTTRTSRPSSARPSVSCVARGARSWRRRSPRLRAPAPAPAPARRPPREPAARTVDEATSSRFDTAKPCRARSSSRTGQNRSER